jgi:Fe(3+) dicitrate transport protein
MTDALALVGEALVEPLLDPASRTWAPALLASLVIAVLLGGPSALRLVTWTHPSSRVDLQVLLVRQLLSLVLALPSFGTALALAVFVARTLDRALFVPDLSVPPLALTLGYSIALFVLSDASRFALHLALHRVAPLWQLHQVHHSAEVLTPLTFHRVHPVESALYEVRGALVTGLLGGVAYWLFRGSAQELTLLGVNAFALVVNVVSGNLRHSHVWLRFGDRAERWLLSPAQHQLHHAVDRDDVNFGTWLACWDRLAGTLVVAPADPPAAYGLAAPNHDPHDLVSALVAPVLGALRPLRPWVAATAALVSVRASAQDAVETDEEGEDLDVIIVEAPDGTPRVAGAAHVIDETELERFAYDDFGRIVARVPGVQIRGEDGFGLRPNIGIRGANSDRSAKITLLEDGVPLAPAPYAAPAAYYFPMPSRLVGVEVFKGPAATRHGPQTIGGAVNVLTRRVPTETAGALDLAYGGWSTFRGHLWAGAGNARRGVLVELAEVQSDGFKHLPDGGPTGFRRGDAMLKARLATAASAPRFQALELKLGVGGEQSNETYLGLSPSDFSADPYQRYAASAGDVMGWSRGQAELAWTLRDGPLELRAVAYGSTLHRSWTKLNRFAGGPDLHDLLADDPSGAAAVFLDVLRGASDGEGPDQVLMIGTNDRALRNGGVRVSARRQDHGEGWSNQLDVQAGVHVDDVARLHTERGSEMRGGALVPTGADAVVTLDSATQARAITASVHDDLRIGVVHALPGVRVERIETWADGYPDPTRLVALPGMSILLEPTPSLALFAGAHRGFSPVAPGSAAGVEPETAVSYELGGRATPGESHVELIGFVSDYANITGQCTLSGGCAPDDLDRQFNGGRALVAGLEALVAQRVLLPRHHTLSVEATYGLTHGTFRTGFQSDFTQFGTVTAGDPLPYVAAHQGGLALVHEHTLGGVGVALRGRSAMWDTAGRDGLRIPGYVALDVNGDLALSDQLSVYAAATNLIGGGALESHRPFGARPSAPAQVMVGVRVR